MAKLMGAQRMVLQAILDASADILSFVEDSQIARTTRIALKDVRDWLETLEREEYVEIARTEAGLSASITAKGRLALGQYRSFPSTTPGPGTSSPPTSATPAAPAATSSVPSPAESETSSNRSNADHKAHLLHPPDLTALAPEERPVPARALAKRPEERRPTCRAFVLGLESAALAEDARLASEKGATTSLKPRDVQPCVEAHITTDTFFSDQKSPEEASRGNSGPKWSAASRPSSTWRNLVVLGGGLLVLLAMATYIIASNKVRPPKTNERLVSEPPPVSPNAGPPFPVPDAPRPDTPRPFVGDRDILAAIRNNLVSTPLTDRPFQRYFTLANLHNNRKVLDHDLRLSCAVLAKLCNSLSWKPMIVVPQSIDPHETVYVVDLRDLGWKERNLWGEILRFEKADDTARFVGARDETHRGYPYGLDVRESKRRGGAAACGRGRGTHGLRTLLCPRRLVHRDGVAAASLRNDPRPAG